MRTEEDIRVMYEQGIGFTNRRLIELKYVKGNQRPKIQESLDKSYAEIKVLEWILEETNLEKRINFSVLSKEEKKTNKFFAKLSKILTQKHIISMFLLYSFVCVLYLSSRRYEIIPAMIVIIFLFLFLAYKWYTEKHDKGDE